MNEGGTLALWLQEVINAVSGNLDRQGGTLVGKGIFDFPKFGRKHGVLLKQERSRIRGFRKTNDAFPGGTLADEILTDGPGTFLLDVLGGLEVLPGAMPSAWLAQAGSFDDGISQQFGQMLRQGTQGRTDVPLVFYCLSTQCWMSYNAALRAIKLGHSNVLWYRGGIEAWKSAGLPIQPAQQGMPPQQGGYPPSGQPGQPLQQYSPKQR